MFLNLKKSHKTPSGRVIDRKSEKQKKVKKKLLGQTGRSTVNKEQTNKRYVIDIFIYDDPKYPNGRKLHYVTSKEKKMLKIVHEYSEYTTTVTTKTGDF